MAECECKIAQLETQLVCPPCKITMNGYTYHKTSKDRWFSPPFYDRPGGYKFCLKVHVSGPRSHVSVFVYLMKGLNDDRLVWPFQGSIEIQLVNQKKHNKSVVIEFDKKAASRGRADRAIVEDTKEVGWGFSQFVSHRRVEKVTDRSQYITDDCLKFIIADITIKCNTIKIIVTMSILLYSCSAFPFFHEDYINCTIVQCRRTYLYNNCFNCLSSTIPLYKQTTVTVVNGTLGRSVVLTTNINPSSLLV